MMIRSTRTLYLTLCVVVLHVWLLSPRKGMSASPTMNVAQETEAEFSYVGGATTRGGGNVTSLDEESGDLKYVVSPQISKRFLLRLGVEWQRFSFGVHHGTALPDEKRRSAWSSDATSNSPSDGSCAPKSCPAFTAISRT